MSIIRCAVIGTGGIGGENHIKGFLQHPQARLVAIAEINDIRREFIAQKYGVNKAYKDYHDLLTDPGVDAVSIAVPNHLHASIAIDALVAGKHVLLEKPMATSFEDARNIIQTWEKSSVVFMVGQNYRFRREVQNLAECVHQGMLGHIYEAELIYTRCSGIPKIGSWFTQKRLSGGGCIYDIGVHYLDMGLFLIGCFDAVCVSGSIHSYFGHRGLGEGDWDSPADPTKIFDVEDSGTAFIKLQNGTTVTLKVSWAMHGMEPCESVKLYGSEGCGILYPARILRTRGNNREMIIPDVPCLARSEERFVDFIECILGNTTPFVNPYDSLKIQAILDAIYESARTGHEVRFDRHFPYHQDSNELAA